MDNSVFHKLTYGLYIVTSTDNDKLAGCIVNTVVQINSKDPLVAVSINKDNYTNTILKKNKHMAINILSKDIKPDIIKKFGFFSSKDTNKFEIVNYELFNNLPVLKEGICGYFIGEIINIVDCNTHDIFIIKVTNTKMINENDVLTYEYYRKNMKGLSPKNAPTYIEEKINKEAKVYKCIICGHIYDDSIEPVPFEMLPDDWQCPVCGVGKDKFKLIN